MVRTLITGGAGFIGSHLAAACLAAGHPVHVIVRPGSDDHRLQHLGGRLIRHDFDLRSEDELRRCIAEAQPERIFHLAARPRRPEDPALADVKAVVQEDLLGLVSLIAAATAARRPPMRIIRTGSLAEYGAAPAPYREDGREAPVSAYGAGLVASTHFCAALQRRLPFPITTARLALTYGPAQSTDYLLPRLIQHCLAGEPFVVHHPTDRRDLVHVNEIVAALMRLATASLPEGMVVNIASGVAPTMREVAKLVIEHTGADPTSITYGDDSASSGAPDFRGSTALAQQSLGWRARIPLSEGLPPTIAWYRAALSRADRRDEHLAHEVG